MATTMESMLNSGGVNIGILLMRMTSCAPPFMPVLSHTHIGDATQKECRANKQLVQWLCWSDVTWARILLICSPGYLKTNATQGSLHVSYLYLPLRWNKHHVLLLYLPFCWGSVMYCPYWGSSRSQSSPSTHWSSYIAYDRWIPVMRLL